MDFFKWKGFQNRFLMACGALLFAAVTALLFGLFLMLLWNWLMPSLFGLTSINYWQAWGIILMSHLLFKGGNGRGPGMHGMAGKHGSRHRGDPKREDWHREFRRRMRHHFEEYQEGEEKDK